MSHLELFLSTLSCDFSNDCSDKDLINQAQNILRKLDFLNEIRNKKPALVCINNKIHK